MAELRQPAILLSMKPAIRSLLLVPLLAVLPSGLLFAGGKLNNSGAKVFSATPAQKDWTVMFYLNGKNDLEGAALVDFNSLEQIGGSTDRVNFVAELGRSEKYETGDGDWHGVRRYLVGKGLDSSKIETKPLQTLSADMGDWKHLADFIRWCKKEFPARRYALVVWDHGTGWKDSDIDDYFNHLNDIHKPRPSRGISIDIDSGHYIRTTEMGKIFEAAGPVDLYAVDACLMQLGEVLYQTGTGPELILASEDVEPADGFDYAASFGALRANSTMGAQDLADRLITDYTRYFEPQQQAVTLSAVRTGHSAEFVARVGRLAQTVMSSEKPSVIKAMIPGTLEFYDPDYRDLHDFCARLAAAPVSAETKDRAQDLMRFIKDKYVSANGTVTEDFRRAGGVSIYLPRDKYNNTYEKLAFSQVTGWDKFIKWYLFK